MTRAFVAVQPPPAVLDAIEERSAAVAMAHGRRTTREQWHITVQFLGDAVDLEAVVSALGAAPFRLGGRSELRLGGAGAFDARGRARILMLGLDVGTEWLGALAAAVEVRLAPLAYTRRADTPAFVPHLTLARFAKPTDLRPVCDAIGADPVGPRWCVDDMVLVESVLHPDGAQHSVRARFPIDSTDGP